MFGGGGGSCDSRLRGKGSVDCVRISFLATEEVLLLLDPLDFFPLPLPDLLELEFW